jgi:protein TonB
VAFLSERGRLAQRLSRPLRPVRRTVNVIIGRAGAGAAPAPGKPKPSGVTRGPALRAGSGGGLGYPEAARKQGLEGVVVLLLSIDATGHVDRVEISESSGHTLLDEAAVQAARTWRFDPAMKNGQPVPGSLVRRVRFRLR